MIVFKYFFNIITKYKFMIILYTVLLLFFGAFNMQVGDNGATSFTASKPDIYVINNDGENEFNNNFYEYIQKNANIVSLDNNKGAIQDALFYRDINAVIEIPQGFSNEFLAGNNPTLNIQKTGDAASSYMEMLINRYMKTANIYLNEANGTNELISKLNNVLSDEVVVEVDSKLNTSATSKATSYYNFANYSLLAGCVFVVAMVISSFREEKIAKRNTISSMKYTNFNFQLFLGNLTFAIILWLLYVIVSFVLVKEAMFTINGVLYIINSFTFTICSLSIAFLIGNLISNKNAINGIVNVVALGSSFLCGAFVPVEWLPDAILKVAHVLPSYWYINNNELIKSIQDFNFITLKPFIINIAVILAFALIFGIITNIVGKKHQKIG